MTSWIASPREISQRRSITVSGVFGIMAIVLIAVGSLLWIYDAGRPSSPPNAIFLASGDFQRSKAVQHRYTTKPIRDIQPIADRVLADNPKTDGQAPSDFGEFVAVEWRILRLVVPKPDREWMKVTLARPQVWIEAAQRDSEGRIWLEFKELGIANWANVLAIEPCPEAAVGEGRLVTGKFEHSSAEVIDLFVDRVSESIGTTSNHPFWSEDRRDFVQAGKLRIGERLRLRDGSTPVVTAAVPRSQSVTVFNLEVDGEHVYYVAASGVLVHNAYEDPYAEYPGTWKEDPAEMPNSSWDYQACLNDGRGGECWEQNGVDFDGITKNGVLLEAKGPGYEKFVLDSGDLDPSQQVRDSILDQGRRQFRAAEGMPIEWHVAEEGPANAIRKLFKEEGVDIPVFFSPPFPIHDIPD